jgi:hypothetical protein
VHDSIRASATNWQCCMFAQDFCFAH